MSRARAYWLLLHPLPSLLTVLVAGAFVMLAARGFPSPGKLAQLLAIEAAMQFSISAFNDYFDRHVDRGRADKPVAVGAISAGVAALLGLVLGAVSLLLAGPLGWGVLIFTAVGLGGGLLYDAGLKYTALSWLPFSIAFPTLPLWAWAGASPDGSFPSKLLWVFPVGGILVLGIHLADTIPDLTSDTEAGVRGLAHRIGLKWSLGLCWGAFTAGTVLTVVLLPVFNYRYRMDWYLPFLITGMAVGGAGIAGYFHEPGRVRSMSLLLELGTMLVAVGWVAAVTL